MQLISSTNICELFRGALATELFLGHAALKQPSHTKVFLKHEGKCDPSLARSKKRPQRSVSWKQRSFLTREFYIRFHLSDSRSYIHQCWIQELPCACALDKLVQLLKIKAWRKGTYGESIGQPQDTWKACISVAANASDTAMISARKKGFKIPEKYYQSRITFSY